jgi:hypothetical protein
MNVRRDIDRFILFSSSVLLPPAHEAVLKRAGMMVLRAGS